MTRRKVYTLVANNLSKDSVEALQALLQRAKEGDIVGVAYAVMYRRRQYTAGVAGECRRNPTFTRGMLCALDDSLSDLVKDDLT